VTTGSMAATSPVPEECTERDLDHGMNALEMCTVFGLRARKSDVSDKWGSVSASVFMFFLTVPCSITAATIVGGLLNDWALITLIPAAVLAIVSTASGVVGITLPCMSIQERDKVWEAGCALVTCNCFRNFHNGRFCKRTTTHTCIPCLYHRRIVSCDRMPGQPWHDRMPGQPWLR
jgi:hypothetical protein